MGNLICTFFLEERICYFINHELGKSLLKKENKSGETDSIQA